MWLLATGMIQLILDQLSGCNVGLLLASCFQTVQPETVDKVPGGLRDVPDPLQAMAHKSSWGVVVAG